MRERTPSRRWRRIAVAGLLATAAPVLLPVAPSAAAGGEHCIVEVTGQLGNGRYTTTAPRCYATLQEALASVGVHVEDTSPSTLSREASSAGLLATVAVHYDGAGYTGSTHTVSGLSCGGGWANLPIDWRNRVSSTWGFCSTVRHWSGINLFGSSEDTTPSGNLSTLNNAADSVQYL